VKEIVKLLRGAMSCSMEEVSAVFGIEIFRMSYFPQKTSKGGKKSPCTFNECREGPEKVKPGFALAQGKGRHRREKQGGKMERAIRNVKTFHWTTFSINDLEAVEMAGGSGQFIKY